MTNYDQIDFSPLLALSDTEVVTNSTAPTPPPG